MSYKQLCITAKQEGKRQRELRRLRQQQDRQTRTQSPRQTPGYCPASRPANSTDARSRECYVCGKTDHIAKQCKLRKSGALLNLKRYLLLVQNIHPPTENTPDHPLQFLESDSDSSVSVVRVTDHGSRLHRVQVDIAGVPATRLIDTGADISIMGPELFKKVAAVAGTKKKQFKPADKLPHTYDCRTFHLDGTA